MNSTKTEKILIEVILKFYAKAEKIPRQFKKVCFACQWRVQKTQWFCAWIQSFWTKFLESLIEKSLVVWKNSYSVKFNFFDAWNLRDGNLWACRLIKEKTSTLLMTHVGQVYSPLFYKKLLKRIGVCNPNTLKVIH